MECTFTQTEVDPEAFEGLGVRLVYDPRCQESVLKASQRIKDEFGLSYSPTLSSPRREGWRVFVRWLTGRRRLSA